MPQTFPDTYSFQLPKTGCDSHAHLAGKTVFPDIEEILERAFKTGVQHIIQVYLSPQSYYNTHAFFDAYPEIHYTMAIHPNDITEKYTPTMIETIKHIVSQDPKFKAIGETGLDFYHKNEPVDLQEKVFKEQLNLAKELNLPVIIHSRDAFQETITILDEMGFPHYPLIWHCFNGNKEQVDMLNKRGWYISIPGTISYPKNTEARIALKSIALDKMLLETDCPFLSPQEWRGQRNEPALTALTAKTIADTLNMPIAELWTICGENAKQVLKLG